MKGIAEVVQSRLHEAEKMLHLLLNSLQQQNLDLLNSAQPWYVTVWHDEC